MSCEKDRLSRLKTEYQPLLIGQRFAVVPPHSQHRFEDRNTLVMGRGAFGSGDHETTRSCIEIMENLQFEKNPKILDLGSGTGILSIAALQLFSGHAWCVDIEPEAVASAQYNCNLNQIQAVTHHCGNLSTLKESDFDLILANIYGDILLDVAEDLVSRTAPGGWMVLSGILWEYNYDVRHNYRQLGCTVINNSLLEDFSTVLLRNGID